MYPAAMRFLLPPDRGSVRVSARAAVLADWMSGWLEQTVDVQAARSYRELSSAIERGDAELVWTPPAVCARVGARARTLLTAVRRDATSCSAALVVRADSGIRSLADLEGKRAAWVDPLSTSGHLMAVDHLREHGLDPERTFSEQRFAGSYRDALVELVEGRADVTSVYVVDGGPDATLRELHDLVGAGAKALTLLATTAPAPYDALVVPHGSPDSTLLETRILALHRRMRPPAMLLEVCRADRFVRSGTDLYGSFSRG